jgi:non-ribosomal peptide synthetase component E (peptide arylation enzyme)
VNRGGEKVSCAEVEAALLDHDGIADVAVVAVPDVRGMLGELVAAVIVPKNAACVPTLESLRAVAEAAGLSKFKLPAHAFVWPGAVLPRGDTGKPLKRKVREFALQQLDVPSRL